MNKVIGSIGSGLGSRARLMVGAMGLAVSVFSALMLVGCGKDDDGKGGGGGDSYTYTGPIATIGSQTWMAKNLDRATPDSKCYENSEDSCAKYGRLYTWADAKTACPSPWHLPDTAEWTQLVNYVGGSSPYYSSSAEIAGEKLKSASGWYNSVGLTDDYGFSALPGGVGVSGGGYFGDARYRGQWWSVTEYNASNAYYQVMYHNVSSVGRGNDGKTNLFSVRCVQ